MSKKMMWTARGLPQFEQAAQKPPFPLLFAAAGGMPQLRAEPRAAADIVQGPSVYELRMAGMQSFHRCH